MRATTGPTRRAGLYTLTASTAQRDGPVRVNLTIPKGDITLQDGTWLMLQAKQGVFIQHSNLLDLSHDVTLYRDDGTTLVTASASMDLKNGAAAGSEPVHAEGPFGTLDAQGGFTLLDKGSSIQFAGPAHLLLNGSNAGGSPAAAQATPSGGASPAGTSAVTSSSAGTSPGAPTGPAGRTSDGTPSGAPVAAARPGAVHAGAASSGPVR